MMPFDVVEARHVGDFVIWLKFRDNVDVAEWSGLRPGISPRQHPRDGL